MQSQENHSANNFINLSSLELEKLVKQFPFLHEAQTALAKKYKDEGHPDADLQLQLAALYTQDRALLRDFVSTDVATVAEVESQQTEDLGEVQIVEPEQQVSVEPLVAPQVFVEEFVEEPVVKVEEHLLAETEVSKETSKPEEFSVSEPHTFSEWLSVFSKSTSTEAPVIKKTGSVEELDELDVLIQSNVPSSVLQDLMEGETHYSKGLEKFIEEQIQKVQVHDRIEASPDTGIDLAKTNDSLEFVTETMAKVYEMQKKYQKAIQAYGALRLKYPEKSDSFAARIEKLKGFL